MSKKQAKLSKEEIEFLNRILIASSNTIHGADYETFVTSTENALKLIDKLGYFIQIKHVRGTLDLSLAGLTTIDTEESRALLADCDTIFNYLSNKRRDGRKALQSSTIATELNLSIQSTNRCLQFLDTNPGITVTNNDAGECDIRLYLEVTRPSRFTEFAKDCVAAQENIHQNYNLDGLANTDLQSEKKSYAKTDRKKQDILSTALYLLSQSPNKYRDKNGKVVADQLAEAICSHFEITLDLEEGAPWEQDSIRKYLSPILKGNHLVSD